MASLIQRHQNEVEKTTHTVIDLFRTSNLRLKTIVLAFTWTVCSALYYVLLLDQSELSTDVYVGFMITALVQLPGYFYVIFTLERPFFGRIFAGPQPQRRSASQSRRFFRTGRQYRLQSGFRLYKLRGSKKRPVS